jgi:acetone carboxylase gamma subunit
MLKAMEMELETGHYSFGVLQNALAQVGAVKAWYKEYGDMDEDSEKFREIIWVLSDKAITRADILTPDFVDISNYRRDMIIQIERSHSILQCEENIKVTLQKVVLTFMDGRTLELIRPKNRSNAEQYDSLAKLIG